MFRSGRRASLPERQDAMRGKLQPPTRKQINPKQRASSGKRAKSHPPVISKREALKREALKREDAAFRRIDKYLAEQARIMELRSRARASYAQSALGSDGRTSKLCNLRFDSKKSE